MLCLRLIAVIDDRLVAIGFFTALLRLSGISNFGAPPEEGQAAAVGVQPVHHIQAFTRVDIRIVGCTHHGHEDGYPAYFSGIRVDDEDRRAAEVDKEFFAGAVLLAHRETTRFFHSR